MSYTPPPANSITIALVPYNPSAYQVIELGDPPPSAYVSLKVSATITLPLKVR